MSYEDYWVDITRLGSIHEEQVNTGTGSCRHRLLDIRGTGEERPWIAGRAPADRLRTTVSPSGHENQSTIQARETSGGSWLISRGEDDGSPSTWSLRVTDTQELTFSGGVSGIVAGDVITFSGVPRVSLWRRFLIWLGLAKIVEPQKFVVTEVSKDTP